MHHIVNSDKSFDQASEDLGSAVSKMGFGVLHVHNLGNTLRDQGIEFEEECKVFEVCNPIQTAKVLSLDMQLNMAMPCRISVYTDNGQTKIGLIKAVDMLSALSDDATILDIADEVEDLTIQMVEKAK